VEKRATVDSEAGAQARPRPALKYAGYTPEQPAPTDETAARKPSGLWQQTPRARAARDRSLMQSEDETRISEAERLTVHRPTRAHLTPEETRARVKAFAAEREEALVAAVREDAG